MPQKQPLSLLTQTGLIIGLISLLAIIGIGSSVVVTKTIQGAGTTINASGMLRMLSYKIATQMLRDQRTEKPNPQDIQQLINRFESQLNHPSLQSSIPKLEFNSDQSLNGEELFTLYESIQRRWSDEIRPLLDEYSAYIASLQASSPTSQSARSYQQAYLSKLDGFVNDIDRMVKAIEIQTEAKIQLLHDIEFIAFPLLLLTILATPYLFYYKIITPLQDLLMTAEEVRNRNFFRHARYLRQDELGKLAQAFNLMISELSATYSELEARISEKTDALIEESNRITLMEERNAIAQELHDSLGQSLFYTNIQVSRMNALIQQHANPVELEPIIREMRETNSSADRQLRELISTFRIQINPEGIDAAAQEIIEREQSRSITRFRFINQIPGFTFSHNEEVHLVQIIREGAANISKHADASLGTVILGFDQQQKSVFLTIEDNGIGITDNPHRPNHFGLTTMSERAASIHGTLSISRIEPHGTRIEVHFPPARPQASLL